MKSSKEESTSYKNVHVSFEKKVTQCSYKDGAEGRTVRVNKILQQQMMFPDLCALMCGTACREQDIKVCGMKHQCKGSLLVEYCDSFEGIH